MTQRHRRTGKGKCGSKKPWSPLSWVLSVDRTVSRFAPVRKLVLKGSYDELRGRSGDTNKHQARSKVKKVDLV